MEVKDVLENYTNLEKECESAKQTVSIELQVSVKIIVYSNNLRDEDFSDTAFFLGKIEETERRLEFVEESWRHRS